MAYIDSLWSYIFASIMAISASMLQLLLRSTLALEKHQLSSAIR